jgi:hypothetical protein
LSIFLARFVAELRTAFSGSPIRNQGDAAQQQIQNDENMQRVKVLNRKVKPEDLESWSQDGIFTIPWPVLLAFKKLGFTSGEEFNHSKDAMHFELQFEVVLKHGRRRSLQQLPGFTVAIIGEALEDALQPVRDLSLPKP